MIAAQLYRQTSLFLFRLGSFDTIISLFQAKDGSYRAGRAKAPLLLKFAVSAFSCYAEQQFIARPHALGVGRTWFADTLLFVILNNIFQILVHRRHPPSIDPQVPASGVLRNRPISR